MKVIGLIMAVLAIVSAIVLIGSIVSAVYHIPPSRPDGPTIGAPEE